MIRRDFLKTLSLTTAALAFPRFAFALAENELPKFFVLIRMQGGWDVTLSLDPKVHKDGSTQSDMFIEYTPDQILRHGPMALGPAMEPMLRHRDGFSIVNGLISSTTDNGHTANLEYLSSGNGEGKAPHIPVEIGMSSKVGPLGVVFQGQVIALDREIMLSNASSIQSLQQAIKLSPYQNLIESSGAKNQFYEAQQSMIRSSATIEKLNEVLEKSGAFKESDSARQAGKILAAAFASGSAYQGQIDLFPNLDSHAGHEGQHLKAQKDAWEQIARTFDDFKAVQIGETGVSVFDRTTFMVISEFARTPALNAAKGKDHNPLTNSALLAGGLIRPNVTFGESHLILKAKSKTKLPSHTALPLNFATGKAAYTRSEAEAGGFKYLTPEILISTVADSLQVDRAKFRSIPAATPSIKAFLKA